MEDKIIKFFGLLEKEVKNIEYGTITVNVVVRGGTPIVETTNIVKSKRKKYQVQKIDKNQDGQ